MSFDQHIQNEVVSNDIDFLNKEIVRLGCKLRGHNLAFFMNSPEGKRLTVLRQRRAELYEKERKGQNRAVLRYVKEDSHGVEAPRLAGIV